VSSIVILAIVSVGIMHVLGKIGKAAVGNPDVQKAAGKGAVNLISRMLK